MSCNSFQLWIVSDDVDDRRRAEEHAAECPACARIVAAHQTLRELAVVWREEDKAPDHLEDKVRQAISEAARRPVVGGPAIDAERIARRRSRLWIALAASFLVGIGLGVLKRPAESDAPVETNRLLAAGDLQIAKAEEDAQVRDISLLEKQVAPILARARDKNLRSHQAARLLDYRTRIATLDVTIADVRGFVEQNPGHPRARTMLLDAYKEKKQVLREVLALEERLL